MMASIVLPIVGAFIILVLGRARRFKSALAVVFAGATALLAIWRLPSVLDGYRYCWQLPFLPGLDLLFITSPLSAFMAVSASLIGAFIVLYSVQYMAHDERATEYYFFVLLFIGSMMGLVYSGNVILMYVFWEMTAICSWRLIGHHRDTPQHLLNADKAFLITVVGSACMLIGFEMLHHQTHTLIIAKMKGFTPSIGVTLLIITGIMAKSAQLPFHTWLPDAGVAPTPVTALLHAAVLVKIGVFAFARLFVGTMGLPPGFDQFLLVILAAGMLVSGCAALVEHDMKRILAYSTVSQLSLILIGFTLGNPVAVTGAVFYILAHGLSKAGLFLGAGVVDHHMNERDIRKLGGMNHLSPANGVGFLLCALSIMGIPPFGGFFAKLFILVGAIQANQIGLAAAIAVAAVLSLLYIMRLWTKVFMGPPAEFKAGPRFDLMSFVVLVFGLLSVISVLFIKYPFDVISNIATQLLR